MAQEQSETQTNTNCSPNTIIDACGYEWVFRENEQRVVLNYPEEILDQQSGYIAWTYEDAIKVLKEGGYL